MRPIKKAITNQILNLKHYGKSVPKSWALVRKKLNSLSKKKSCITYIEFKEICKQISSNSFKEKEDFFDCSLFLYNIGVILWYKDDDILKDWVILQPQWAMNAVYIILDDNQIQEREGHIIPTDFLRLWDHKLFQDYQLVLKRMLEIFKISFQKKNTKDHYIIPARLNSMPFEKEFTNYSNYITLDYVFVFMPRGIVNHLSAQLNRYIENNNDVWNNAVNFTLEKHTQAQVKEDFFNKKISIKVIGNDSRALILIIKDSIENIVEEYRGVSYTIEIPCNCNYCIDSEYDKTIFDYNKLIEWSHQKEFVFCNESSEKIQIKKLLYNYNEIKKMKRNNEHMTNKKLFISYSKHDIEYLDEFQDHLVTLKKEGLITYDCREIELGSKWDESIKKEIDECDIMVFLISVKFLNTDYITSIEIPKAIEQNKTIVPIIIKACDWENSELGKYQATQRGKVVSLDNDLRLNGKIKGVDTAERDAFWTSIIKEMRTKLFK